MPRQLRVVLSAVAAKSGGAVTYLVNLLPELSESPHEYIVIVPPETARRLGDRPGNVRIVSSAVGHRSPWKRFLWDQVVLRWYLRRMRADVLVSTSDFGVLISPCPQILYVRNPLFFSDVYRRHILGRKSLPYRLMFAVRQQLVCMSTRAADVVVTATAAMLEDLKRHVAIVNAVVIPFGGPPAPADDGAELDELPVNPLYPRLLFVSEYSDHKGLWVLLKAIEILAQRGHTRFEVVSTAHPDDFPDSHSVSREHERALLRSPSVRLRIRFTRTLPYAKTLRLYRHAEIFVFPSLAESYAHPLVEAMTAGLPIIASDLPVHREICGDTAILVRPADAVALADELERLLTDVARRRAMAEASLRRARYRASWRDHAGALVSLVEAVAQPAIDTDNVAESVLTR